MTPDSALSTLDRYLVRVGQPVTVLRYTGTAGNPRPSIKVDGVPAFDRAVKAEDFFGAIDQSASNVTLSPTLLGALLPLKKGDKLVIEGRERHVEMVKSIVMGGKLVRLNLLVLG